MAISALNSENTIELMYRLKKFADSIEPVTLDEARAVVDLGLSCMDADPQDFTIKSHSDYPGQWRLEGAYIEAVARMTHWEYPEAVERFSRVIEAIGVNRELDGLGGMEGDLIMIDRFDFDFYPSKQNPYIPQELIEEDERMLREEEERRARRLGMQGLDGIEEEMEGIEIDEEGELVLMEDEKFEVFN